MKRNYKTSERLLIVAIVAIACLSSITTRAQVSINADGAAPHNSAILDLDVGAFGANDKKGLLIPRVSLTSTTDVTTIPSPANSLVVYNTNAGMTNGNGVGFYYWDSGSGKWMYMPTAQNGPGTAGQVLTSQGGGNPPQWSTLSLNGGGGSTGCSNCVTMISPVSVSAHWGDCASYCRDGTWGGYTDWRMPTFEEAIDYTASGNVTLVGGATLPYDGSIWTSTPAFYNLTGSTSTGNNWVGFSESTGYWSWYSAATTYNRCRCVR